jgi:hypothetical protein
VAQIIARTRKADKPASTLQIRLDKAGQKMLKDARDLTLRKGTIDSEILNLRVSQADAPVRKIKKS